MKFESKTPTKKASAPLSRPPAKTKLEAAAVIPFDDDATDERTKLKDTSGF
ncbi:hypothetical protein D3C87_1994980 [compost metagenome]